MHVYPSCPSYVVYVATAATVAPVLSSLLYTVYTLPAISSSSSQVAATASRRVIFSSLMKTPVASSTVTSTSTSSPSSTLSPSLPTASPPSRSKNAACLQCPCSFVQHSLPGCSIPPQAGRRSSRNQKAIACMWPGEQMRSRAGSVILRCCRRRLRTVETTGCDRYLRASRRSRSIDCSNVEQRLSIQLRST